MFAVGSLLSSRKCRVVGVCGLGYVLWYEWRMRLLRRAVRRGGTVGPRWLARLSARSSAVVARVVSGVTVASSGGEGLAWRGGQLMIVWHPHGFIAYTPSMIMGEWAVAGHPHGREWFGLCLPALFKLPWLGEHFTLTNARPVDRASLETLLASGATVAIQPGGVREQAATRHDQEQAFFGKKLGFVRQAIKHGTPLMPVYFFGENQMYTRVAGGAWITRAIKKATGMVFPVCTGWLGLPMCWPLPHATALHVRWGRAVPVGDADADPSDERVREVFEAYLAELMRLFDAHAHDCLPPHVADRGLRVVVA